MSLLECPETWTFRITMNLQSKIRGFMALAGLDVIL